jgi:iron complex transport system ATP-binding protein
MLAAQDLTLAGRLAGLGAALRPGEITAICGPNGAGKSTLLACLAGLLEPDGGTVALDAAPLAKLAPRERAQAIGYLPQTPEVAWDVSVETLVGLGRLPWGDANPQPVAAALAALDLTGFARRPVSQLSGGERARALLARVLAGEPRWLLADEPLAALDLAHQLALLGTFHKLARDEGKGVVLVLHDLTLAMNHAQRVLVLDGGKLAADGPPEQALSEAVIAQVWGVAARWLGQSGARALVIPATSTRAP